MPTPQQLRAEIDADPAGLGYAARVEAGDDAGLARLLNAPIAGATVREPMRASVFGQFLAARGLRRKVKAGEAHPSDAVASICLYVDDLLKGAADRAVDPDDPAVLALVDALVAAGVAAPADKAAFLAACTRPGSRAETHPDWGRRDLTVSADAVAAAFGRV